jgi:hypothetical protein
MTSDFKVYLGAIEVEIDGLHYEIGLRKENGIGLRGLWTCMTCGSTEETSDLRPNDGEAIALAKLELNTHHEKCHLSSARPKRQARKPR